jgi:hypothetical protein
MKILSPIACLVISSFLGLASAQDEPLNENNFTLHAAALLKKTLGQNTVSVKAPLIINFGQLQLKLDGIFRSWLRNYFLCR